MIEDFNVLIKKLLKGIRLMNCEQGTIEINICKDGELHPIYSFKRFDYPWHVFIVVKDKQGKILGSIDRHAKLDSGRNQYATGAYSLRHAKRVAKNLVKQYRINEKRGIVHNVAFVKEICR